MITTHHNAIPATPPIAFTNSNVGHAQSHAGTVSTPVINPRMTGAHSASILLGFRSTVACSIGNYI
jgi:hypothetical protein